MSRPEPEGRSALWCVRAYAPGDAVPVTRLFSEVFGWSMSVAHYRWKLIESPWPIAAPNVWLAEAGTRIVGQYAGTPMRFQLGAVVVPVLHGCDVMTAADFRRQGVLTAVGTAATEAWTAAGVRFVLGLHYGGWGTRRHHLGWREMFKASWFRRLLRPDLIVARRYRLPKMLMPVMDMGSRIWNMAWNAPLRWAARGVEVGPVDRPGPEFEVLWESLRARYEALVVRDRAWVTYRYADAPDITYQLLLARQRAKPLGYLVYRVTIEGERRRGWILDLFTAPEDARTRAALLHAGLVAMHRAGVGSVRVLASEGTLLVPQLRRAGFFSVGHKYDISLVNLTGEEIHPALRDPNRWFTMAGDYDVL